MDRVIVSAPAKINLFLAVTGIAGNGYHLLRTVMHTVGLCDTVIVERVPESGIRVACSRGDLPQDEGNIAYRAAKAFLDLTGAECGLRVRIEKRIPSEAGLGGGSADAAAVLVGLNHMLGVGYDTQKLCDIGLTIGADVPFCLTGGCALAEGIGERLTPLRPLRDCAIMLAKPERGISTRDAYRAYDERAEGLTQEEGTGMLRALETGEAAGIGGAMYNVFEQVADVEECLDIKAHMLRRGAAGAVLSGSGSAVAGLFSGEEAASVCRDELSGRYWTALTKPLPEGARILSE